MNGRLVMLLILLVSLNAISKEIYVNNNCGDDNWSGESEMCSGTDGPKATIQAAIDSAIENDNIIVMPGIYHEDIDFSGKNIIIKGSSLTDLETIDKTVIQGTGAGCVVKINTNETNCAIAGVTITGGQSSGDSGGGIKCVDSSSIVSNCIIRGNQANKGGAVYASGANVRIISCYIYDNKVSDSGGGIFVEGNTTANITNCVMYANNAGWGGAIVSVGSIADIVNCTIANNSADEFGGAFIGAYSAATRIINTILYHNAAKTGQDIYLLENASASVTSCIVDEGPYEVYVSGNSTIDLLNNLYSVYAFFPNQDKGDYRLIMSDEGVDSGVSMAGLVPETDIDGNPRVTDGNSNGVADIDIGAYEFQNNMDYVIVSPNGNYRDYLPLAINAVENQSEEVSIPLELYKMRGIEAEFELEEDCEWLSLSQDSGTMSAIISIDLIADVTGVSSGIYETEVILRVDSAVNGYLKIPVSLFVSEDPTVKNVPNEIDSIQKAIDLCRDGDTVVVEPGIYYENINFRNRNIELTSIDPDSNSVVEDTVIDGSKGYGSTVTFENGLIQEAILSGFTIQGGKGHAYGSEYYGGGVYCESSSPVIQNNIIRDNDFPSYEDGVYGLGGGVFCNASGAVIENNYIINNSAFEGGGIFQYGYSVIRNNMVSGNSAYYAGGLCIYNRGIITGNTIDNNNTDWEGGNLYVIANISDTLELLISNNNITNAKTSGIYMSDPSPNISYFRHNNVWGNGTVDYETVTDQTGLNGNISVDPMYVNNQGGDYHLLADSLCISAGDPLYQSSESENDIDGESRLYAGIVDIGADEYVGYVKPVANAGEDQFHDDIVEITLDASGSYFAEETSKTYNWVQVSGPIVDLQGGDTETVTFPTTKKGIYVFSLTVYDGINWSVADTIMVVVGNRAPVAVVVSDFASEVGKTVYLDGSGSYDLDADDELTWSWEQIDGPVVELSNADTAIPDFSCLEKGTYVFELTVSDGIDTSETVQLKVIGVEVDLVVWEPVVKYNTTDYFHYPDFAEKRVAYGVGDACDFTWDIRVKDLITGAVRQFWGEGGSADTQPKLDGDIMVWFATGIGWGDPWQHEPSNASIFAYDFNVNRQYALRKFTWTTSYSHPAISGRKVVWLEHLGIDPRPSGSSEAANWYNTTYSICGADISDLEVPVYFTIAENVGKRDPYPCFTYSSDFDDVIDICGNIVVWEAQGDIYGADISDINNIKVFPICTNKGLQTDPCISGTMVAWTDTRNDAGDIYGADLTDVDNITVVPLVKASGFQTQPAIEGNILCCINDEDVDFYCMVAGCAPMKLDIDDPYIGEGVGVQIGATKNAGEYVAVWQTYEYGEARGVFINCGYTVADGPVVNKTTSKEYDTIQNAIYAAVNEDILVLEPKTYEENLYIKGKAVTVSSQKQNNQYLTDSTILQPHSCLLPAVTIFNAEGEGPTLEGLAIKGRQESANSAGLYISGGSAAMSNCIVSGCKGSVRGSGILMAGGDLDVSSCAFYNNSATESGAAIHIGDQAVMDLKNILFYSNSSAWGGALACVDSTMTVQNCTFADNQATGSGGAVIIAGEGEVRIDNSIFANNDAPQGQELSSIRVGGVSDVDISYTNILGGLDRVYIGPECRITWLDGIVDVNPVFVDSDLGDYHLKSAAGRWDNITKQWSKDLVTSGCIDAGNLESGCGAELWPHGGIRNLGAYGGTAEASMSLDDKVGCAADFTNDGKVNMLDLAVLANGWLSQGYMYMCDIDRDNLIDVSDLNSFAEDWLSQE